MEDAEFQVIYPCYVVESPNRSALSTVTVDGRTCVAFFTDEELASHYVTDKGGRGLLRSFTTPEELAVFLRSLDTRQFAEIAFDPVGVSRTFRISIEDLLAEIDR